jgi:hypothetical protein
MYDRLQDYSRTVERERQYGEDFWPKPFSVRRRPPRVWSLLRQLAIRRAG